MRDIEDLIAEEAAQNPVFLEKVGESIELHGLLQHPGWIALKEHFERGKEGYGKELVSRQLAGQEVSQRDIDYMRGCKEMAEAIFRYPTQALSQLERTAERLLAKEFEREVIAHSEQSPYIEREDT
jgi:hypothetical protein